jgi:hypothetical protein
VEDLTVEVKRLKRSWTRFLLGAVSGSGSGADWESISHYPEVALCNSAGSPGWSKWPIATSRPKSLRPSWKRTARCWSASEWCERYEVPPSFADG